MLKKFALVFAVVITLFVGQLYAEISCISCSSQKDPNCAQYPMKIMGKSCASKGQDVSCYTRTIDGTTLRGCTDEMDQGVLDTCVNSMNCTTCRSLNENVACNTDIFPGNRRACHICTGDLNSNCSKSIAENPVTCQLFHEDDQCFIKKTAKGIERGCLSDSGTKCANSLHCYICNGNGCNKDAADSTNIPVAPSSATMWKYSTVFVTALIAFSLKTLL